MYIYIYIHTHTHIYIYIYISNIYIYLYIQFSQVQVTMQTLHGSEVDDGSDYCMAISPDSRLIAAGSEQITIWDAVTGRDCKASFNRGAAKDCIESLDFSNDGTFLAMTTWNGCVQMWSLCMDDNNSFPMIRELSPPLILPESGYGKSIVAVSPNSRLVARAQQSVGCKGLC
jgi:WD40 repeat protein